jgi:hypothetical protein
MKMKKATLALLALAVLVQVGAASIPASGRAPIDNLYLEARKLEATDNPLPSDQFGRTVAVSGNTALVGNLADDAPGALDSGSAYIFERDYGGTDNWGEVKKLVADDAAANDQFGVSLAIDGDVAVVGAFGDDGLRGAAYVFERHAGGTNNWGQVKKLVASDRQLNDRFGNSVAVSGDTILVGALLEDGGCPPTNTKCASGSAYIFERNEGGKNNWGESKKILPDDPQLGQTFGNCVALSGDYAAICAISDPTVARGQGAAYAFGRNEGGTGNWGQMKKLIASDGNDNDKFGKSIGISGHTIVVGAFSADIGGSNFVGAAYVFEKDYPWPNKWGEIKKLTASDAQFNDQFGISVAIKDNSIIVGAFAEDSACPPGTAACDAGKAYLYGRHTQGPNNWGEIHPVVGSGIGPNDFFGQAVSISRGVAIVSAHHKANDGANNEPGAAYVFTTLRPRLHFIKYD